MSQGTMSKKDIAAIAHDMSDAVVTCRSLLHSWKPDTAYKVRGGFEVTYKCSRNCGAKRRDFISRVGEVLARTYEYAEGYRIEGLGRAPAGFRDNFRIESVMRLDPQDKPADE